MKIKTLVLLFFLILLSSCSKENRTDRGEKIEKAIYPDVVLENAKCQISQQDGSPIMLEGEKIEFYSKDEYCLLENFSFSSYSESGEIEVEGSGNSGKIWINSGKIEIEGNVSFSKTEDNMLVLASSLVYDKEKDEIITKGRVEVRNNTSHIIGFDFVGDLREEAYSFSLIEKGELDFD